jgi:integrase
MPRWDPDRNSWRIVVDVNRPGEKRRRRYHDVAAPNTAAGKKTAQLAELRIKADAAEVREKDWPGGTARGVTFAAAAAARVLRNRDRWSPKTLKETEYALRRYILPTLGKTPLEYVTPAQVEAMYASWSAAGHQGSTMRRWHNMVAAIFADAERLGELVGRNPMVRVRPAGGKAPERSTPSPADVRRVIEAAPAPSAATYFELAVNTGARRGTILALRWRDIDLDAGIVSFTHAVAEGPDGAVVKGTKANRPYTVQVMGPALNALREHRRRAAETALALGLGALDPLFVFSDDGGEHHWDVSWPSHAWLFACRRAGVAACRLHDVRHFAATRALAAGVPTRVIADRLGCTEANVIRTYSHRVPSSEDARAAQVLATAMGG